MRTVVVTLVPGTGSISSLTVRFFKSSCKRVALVVVVAETAVELAAGTNSGLFNERLLS